MSYSNHFRGAMSLPLPVTNDAATVGPAADCGAVVEHAAGYLRLEEITGRPATLRGGAGPPPIASIGIPTRNRPRAVLAAVQSFRSTIERRKQPFRVLIADGSSLANQLRLKLELQNQRFAAGLRIEHLDDAWRAGLIRAIRDETQCSVSTLRFALFGDDRCLSNYGANRNALLLASAGELSVQVDDDTRLPLLVAPKIEAGLSLSSEPDPQQYWYGGLPPTEVSASADFLAEHESMLGIPVHTVISSTPAESVTVDRMGGNLLAATKQPATRIVLTMMGHCGDAGTVSNAARLFVSGPSFQRLVAPGYDRRVRSRHVVRTVTRRTVGDGLFCMGMNMGLDHREPLPPFVPVGRNEDGVFSAALTACYPNFLRGFLNGYLLQHRPEKVRPSYGSPVRFNGFRVNDLLVALIGELGRQGAGDAGAGLRALGRSLAELSALDQTAFDRLCRCIVRNALVAAIQQIDAPDRDRNGMPEEMEADRAALRASAEQLFASENGHVPIDLVGPAYRRQAHLRELVGAYGELLINWPEMVDVARHVRVNRNGHL